jgi:hypothetical protein
MPCPHLAGWNAVLGRKGLYASFHYLGLQGQIDQLEDRDIRNVEAAGSNPALSTFFYGSIYIPVILRKSVLLLKLG